jgi:hypothetical protein
MEVTSVEIEIARQIGEEFNVICVPSKNGYAYRGAPNTSVEKRIAELSKAQRDLFLSQYGFNPDGTPFQAWEE